MVISKSKKIQSIGAVISAHGFGHAARTTSVLERLRSRCRGLQFEIFSEVPEWFFKDTLGDDFTYHAFPTDVGVIQDSPFEENLQATYHRLLKMYSNDNSMARQLAQVLSKTNCRFVLCDISPLGILAAYLAGIPSVLVENFTWDWIYAGYLSKEPRLAEINDILKSLFTLAIYHVQTEPVCVPRRCDLVTSPIARQSHQSRSQVREQLGIREDIPLVLITTGGIEQKYPAIERLATVGDKVQFVLPGGSNCWEKTGNITLLPHHSEFFHPDLVYASDAVVGKLGYSTIAEAYHAGIPFAYVPRDQFRETNPLASFVRNNLGGFEINSHDFFDGSWLCQLPALLQIPRQHRSNGNGSDELTKFILEIPGLIDSAAPKNDQAQE